MLSPRIAQRWKLVEQEGEKLTEQIFERACLPGVATRYRRERKRISSATHRKNACLISGCNTSLYTTVIIV